MKREKKRSVLGRLLRVDAFRFGCFDEELVQLFDLVVVERVQLVFEGCSELQAVFRVHLFHQSLRVVLKQKAKREGKTLDLRIFTKEMPLGLQEGTDCYQTGQYFQK